MSDVMYYCNDVIYYCEDCEHFRILVEPYADGLNMGVAECTEHGLVKDFVSHRELKSLKPCEQFKERH